MNSSWAPSVFSMKSLALMIASTLVVQVGLGRGGSCRRDIRQAHR